ncbi:MAG: T9SS type A sorting domain-containing protein [Saprospiraceae bacterium]|jgi:hypothetical protein|nr:T9SS type A sorting domain-containing protein [Saprospiraceae bacterium]
MKRLFLLFFCTFYAFSQANAQAGCTDPQANNFDEDALQNDGSCTYSATNYEAEEITEIPSPLTEPSGLAFFDGKLWTHLDSGNEDKIFQIDTLTGEILHTVIIVGGDNIDWEELAEDETYLYIGDFGNNPGNRTDLRIFRIEKSQLSQNAASVETIEFSYSDQTDFSLAPNMNNYDCEAFFEHNDSLHLFSKNWVDFQTRHYVLPKTPGTHIADLRDSFLVLGQVTAADITNEGEIALLGYNIVTSQAFMWLLFDYQGTDFFSGNKRKIGLGNVLNISQPEGLVFSQGKTGFICAENISIFPQKLLKFSIMDWVTNEPNGVFDLPKHTLDFSVFPNPFADNFNIKLDVPQKGQYKISLIDSLGKTLKTNMLLFQQGEQEIFFNTYDLKLAKGNYFIQISNEENFGGKVIFKN